MADWGLKNWQIERITNCQLSTEGRHGGTPSATLRPYQLSTVNYQLSTIYNA
ncbi:MAG: hypothetical protein HC786_31745 [Richelia sp. CSU_2_1]|nr:hypothetical protein [Microcoleus sp. SU_5_6]NJR26349.1 hypothetical protein [Richelia sp. CSU_2_1]